MGKFKDTINNLVSKLSGGPNSKNPERRSFVLYAILATLIFLIMVGFVNQNSIVRWVKAGVQIRNQERQIERYQTEIKEMDERIDALTSNKDSLETFARENFGFAEPGDEVYVIENE